MDEPQANNLQPLGENLVPHAASETDVAQVADRMHDRAAELANQVGSPEVDPSADAKEEEALPLDRQLDKVESLVAQTAADVGATAPNDTAPPRESPKQVQKKNAVKDPPSIAPSPVPAPASQPAAPQPSQQGEVGKNKPRLPRVKTSSLWESAAVLSGLKICAACCGLLDVVFRWVPASIKPMIGYAAVATTMTSVAVWVYVLVT